MAPPQCWACQITARSGWASEGGSRMGDFLLGFGLLPYGIALARGRVLARQIPPPPPSSLSGPMPVPAKFQGPGPVVHLWHCIIIRWIAATALRFSQRPPPDAPARLSGGARVLERAHRADSSGQDQYCATPRLRWLRMAPNISLEGSISVEQCASLPIASTNKSMFVQFHLAVTTPATDRRAAGPVWWSLL